MDLNKELVFIPIPVTDEDIVTGVSEWAGDLGEDWDIIFMTDGVVTKNTKADIARVMGLIEKATGV